MTLTLAGLLLVLALVDSTSIGTLIVPMWLLLATGRRGVGKVVLYLVTIGAFYLALGLVLAAGARAAFVALGDALDSPAVSVAAVVVGVALVWWSYRIDPKTKAKRGEDPHAAARRWHARISTALGSTRGVVVLALVAGLLEAASMVPYLAAIGALSAADLGVASTVTALTAYCLVMIAPALVLVVLRVLAARWVDRPLERLAAWAERSAASATAWTVGIVGVLIGLQGLGGLAG
ncbi:GAP family protein [Mumia quercus]|uniref:GAP family protein n=1 Tax=Mumia quercus TaxID=2976125 RepID=UPI0021D15F8D|nr:GAP family protein [Mumia quercus]